MDPIVSPWIIYGIEMLRPLNFLVGWLFLLFAIVSIYGFDSTDEPDDQPIVTYPKSNLSSAREVLLVLTAILGILFVFLPSRETGYKMLAASYVTTDNIRAVGGATNEAIDSILDNVVKHLNEVKK